MLAIPKLRSLQILSQRKNSADYLRKRNVRFLILWQVFPFSQKVTQAELFASAHFVRIFMTPPFLLENG